VTCARLILAAALLLTFLAGGAAASVSKRRAVEFAIALEAVQTTTWTAHGSYAWCSNSTQRLPYDGSGRVTLHLSLASDARGAAAPAAPLYLAATVRGTAQRSGSYVEHDAAVTDRPPGCPALDTADTAAETGGCGRRPTALAVALESGVLRSKRSTALPSDSCPWLGDLHLDGSNEPPPAILGHAETYDGLVPLALGRLSTPAAPRFAPATAARHSTQIWHVTIPGGTLAVTTTTQVRLRVALLPLIEPGRSIAGIRLGETLAELRRASGPYGGFALPDSADQTNGEHRWEWSLQVATPYLDDQGNRLYEDVYVSAPTHGDTAIATHRPPPPNARVTRIGSVSQVEVTPEGIGSNSTLAELRRAYPRGHLLVFGGPIAWLVEGPGRHRTAFMLYHGVVQDVQIGCPQTNPVERGAPVDDAAPC
jgi:hypothetical protein